MSAAGPALCAGQWTRKVQTSDETANCKLICKLQITLCSASQPYRPHMAAWCCANSNRKVSSFKYQICESGSRMPAKLALKEGCSFHRAGSQGGVLLSFVLLELHHPAVMLRNAGFFFFFLNSQLPQTVLCFQAAVSWWKPCHTPSLEQIKANPSRH